MSYKPAIRVKGLSKTFQLYKSPVDRLKQIFSKNKYYQEFWALKDVSFDVKKGETIGIVGRNGSGKSTLLQIICGTLSQSAGEVKVNGKVAALLELGSGFNPEFTGKENIWINASILGLSNHEISSKYQKILDFAEIGDFVNQPVKTYSSGMILRLAFSVLINTDPEILVVDEALAVGDEAFQRKCFSRIEEMKKKGVTIFFVSHSAQAILQLCDRAILIDKGEVILEGQPKMVISYYQKYINATSLDRIDIRNAILEKYRRAELTKVDGIGSDDVISPENNKSSSDFLDILPIEEFFDETLISKSTVSHICHGAKIKNIQLTKLNGEKVNVLVMGKTYRISYDVEFSQAVQNVGFGIGFTNPSGLLIAGANCDATRLDFVAAGKTIKANFEFNCHFLSGHYFLTCHVRGVDKNGEEEITLHRIIDGLIFKVGFYGPMLSTGIFDLSIQVDIGSEDNG